MIRNKIYKEIALTIEKQGYFEYSDFKVEETSEYRGTKILIKYLIEPKYTIVFNIPNSAKKSDDYTGDVYEFSGKARPGPVAYEETFSFTREKDIYSAIEKWLNCIWEELSDNPIIRNQRYQQQQIDEILEKFATTDEEEYFFNRRSR